MLVLGQPLLLVHEQRIVQPRDQRRRRVPCLERRGVDERLERRSGLPLRLEGAIEPALGEVAAADQREHVSVGRIHGDERPLQVVGGLALFHLGQLRARRVREAPPAFDVLEILLDQRLGAALQIDVERGEDAQASLRHARPAEPIDQLAAHRLLEILAGALVDLEAVDQLDRHLLRALRRRCVDRAGIDHRLQHDRPAGEGPIQVARRRVRRWRLDESCEQRRLVHGQIRSALSEIPARGGFDAVEPVAEVRLVQVHLEDLVLRVLALDVAGEDDFLQLAAVGLAASQEAQARELLRDGAAAFRAPARFQVANHGADGADGVDATVLIEPLILDRDDRLDEVGRHLLERQLDPLLLEDREGVPVPGVEDRRRLRHVAEAVDGVALRQPRGQVVTHPGRYTGGKNCRDGEDGHHCGQQQGPASEELAGGVEETGQVHSLFNARCAPIFARFAGSGGQTPVFVRRERIAAFPG